MRVRGEHMDKTIINKMVLPQELQRCLQEVNIIVPKSRQELFQLALGKKQDDIFEVSYDVPDKGKIVEATVVRCKNGLAVNYTDIYMRRRDPDCMIIADEGDTDKTRYITQYEKDFEPLRSETFKWLVKQEELIVMPFMAGGAELGYEALLVAPANTGFFAGALADLQAFISGEEIQEGYTPRAIIYLAPPFRHSHFNGKQIVVHNRLHAVHELFSYNLYPGPSAKKGIYGVLLHIGESEGWTTLHGSTVRVITPYENIFTIMHEGASGGGKSEMIQAFHREADGRVLLGQNTITEEKYYIDMTDACDLQPVTDDMALCHPTLQKDSKKLVVTDAEDGWFLRIDHITQYGTEPNIEALTIHPEEPLVFLNIEGHPGSTCLIWEHTLDAPGKPCSNPRVIMPRRFIPHIIDKPVEVDIRSFGVRTPPSTKEMPGIGIMGIFHVLPPALAWLWRLVSPRGYSNPSIIDSEEMVSEGVGSYWPFATGKMVDQANLLLDQMLITPKTGHILIPNQHIGAYKVGFMPQWIAREYLSRRGSVMFRPEQLTPSKSPLLGYALQSLRIDGFYLPKKFLQVQYQAEVGNEGFEKGDQILREFFKKELKKYLVPELHSLGHKIIELCLKDGGVEEYAELIPLKK